MLQITYYYLTSEVLCNVTAATAINLYRLTRLVIGNIFNGLYSKWEPHRNSKEIIKQI